MQGCGNLRRGRARDTSHVPEAPTAATILNPRFKSTRPTRHRRGNSQPIILTHDKATLRRRFRQARAALPPTARRAAARAALRIALRHGLLLKGRRWGFYLPVNGEFDVLPLLNQALWMGKHCYLPVIPKHPGRPLQFVRLNGRQNVGKNRYGIPEPHGRRVPVRHLEILVLPLVAFDDNGHRLGMGGGYYDATLAHQRRTGWPRPWRLGLAYECQRAEALPAEPWDIGLNALLSEAGLRRFRTISPQASPK